MDKGDDIPASGPGSTPPPAPLPSGLLGYLGRVNTIVSVIAAVAGSIAAILSIMNKSAVERIDKRVKGLELRQKVEQASRDYAQLFMDRLLSEERLKGNEKRVQAILSLLNIAAQASGNAEGESNAKTRAMTPIVLALLLNEPGGVAEMDESYLYLDDWVAIACADNSIKTRVTALQALGGICQKALRAGRLDVVVKGVRAFDQLMALLPDNPKDPDYLSVLAVRTQLKTFIKKEDRLLAEAKLPGSATSLGDENVLRTEIREAFPLANAATLETQAKVKAEVDVIEEATAGSSPVTKETKKTLTDLKISLAELDAALATASQVAQAQISLLAAATPRPLPSGSGAASPQSIPVAISAPATIKKYIEDLQSPDIAICRRAGSQLALLGQATVKSLVPEIAGRFGHNGDADDRLRLGAATAFHFMVQPIALDSIDAYWIVSLLRSNDSETRKHTAEFLMNLESETSLQNCFNELEKLFYEQSGLGNDGGNAVINASVVVATWARNIGRDTPSGVANVAMPQLALVKAKEWRAYLNSRPDKVSWTKTLSNLEDLIKRAEAIQGVADLTTVANKMKFQTDEKKQPR